MGGEHERRRLHVGITAEIVERDTEPDGTRRMLIAVRTLEGSPPLRSELRILDPELDEEQIADLAIEAVRHDLLEAAASAERFRAADTLTDLATLPRISHEDRAEMLAKLIVDHGAKFEATHGKGWLKAMIASELRAVYADGERKGYGHAMAGAASS